MNNTINNVTDLTAEFNVTTKETDMNTSNQSIASEELNMNKTTLATSIDTEVSSMDTNLGAITDLTAAFSSFFTNSSILPAEASEELSEARTKAVERMGFIKVERAEKALATIALYHMIQSVGKDTWLGEQLFTLGVSNTQWWANKVKDEKITHGRRYYNALVEMVGENHEAITLFKQAVNMFKDHKVIVDDNGVTSLIKLEKKGVQVVGEEVIKTFSPSPVKLSMAGNKLKVLVKYNSVITPIKGQEFVFGKNTGATFGIDVINTYLTEVLGSIRIHNERTEISDRDLFATENKEYTMESYKFHKEDALVLLLLLKENNIDIKELFANVKEGKKKTLILARDIKLKGVKSIHRISVPAYTFKKKYSECGVTSLNDAKQGFIVPMVTIPRLVEFTKDAEGYDIVVSRENINKTINRFDKLDNAKALWTQWAKVFVVCDPTAHPLLNKSLVGGNILTPDDFILTNGVCRVVTDMDNGGIKSTTVPFKGIDSELAKGDVCVVSSAGFKGGMLSALGMAYGDTNLVENLFPYLEGLSTTDAILDSTRKAVLDRMTTMVIGGEEVQGIMVTVELKITNAYTVDMFMRPKAEDKEVTLEDEKARVRQNIENLIEEIETESKSSTGLRAYVAEQKAASSDLFRVADWIKSELAAKTLVRKPLVTKVISQEIQSIAHWYGKETAVEFLEDLLSTQAENGMDIEKLYAIQYLGAVEKDIRNTVNVQEIVDVFLKSTIKVNVESALYDKDTMKEIMSLIGNDVYGWTSVIYQDGTKVDLPLGKILTNDLEEQYSNDKKYVIVKGLLNDLLENIKGMMKEDGTLYPKSESHMVMKALVQKQLLGKSFGYQYTKGYYGVAMPLIGNYAVTTAGVTNRDRLEKSDDMWVKMTLSKAPQYFEGMTSCYDVLDLHFGADMNLMLECGVFVNPEIVLMHQNDFDGDMYRITVGKVLPYVATLYNRFNGAFFKDFYEGELEGNVLDIKASQKCYLEEYHEAVNNAVLAKGHIGSYTANSYFYEAALANLIDTSFDDLKGNEIVVTKEDAYVITSIMKMLIQIEAMDNVKQEGSSTFITEMLLHYKLRSIKGYNGVSDEAAIKNKLNELYKALVSLVKSKDLTLTEEDVARYVAIIYHTAVNFNSKEMTALNMFNARVVNEKHINNVTEYLSGGEYDNTYDFEGAYARIIGGIDKESMYYEIIVRTVETLSGNATIRI